MRVLIACDSFKDALAAATACAAIARGLKRVWPDAKIAELPLSDGGEGAIAALKESLSLELISVTAADPLGRPVVAEYGLSADRTTAVVEMAKTSGLELLGPEERNPEKTTTFGVGELLRDARARGVRRVLLAIGGSATNDGGVGAAAALGWRFLDAQGREAPPTGGGLGEIIRILAPETPLFERLEVLCDVDNPLCGPTGAARVYGPQKGADPEAAARLDAGLSHLAGLVEAQLGRQGLAAVPGAGAAGGLGFGAMAFLGGELRRGADVILDCAGFDALAHEADLVITGEGRLDAQTAHGKLIATLASRARGTPVVALCGAVDAAQGDLQALGVAAALPINDGSGTLKERLARAGADLENAAAQLARSWKGMTTCPRS